MALTRLGRERVLPVHDNRCLTASQALKSAHTRGGGRTGLRAYFVMLGLTLTLSACQPEETEPTEPAFFLTCSGTAVEPMATYSTTKLFRVPPPDSGEGLAIYNVTEKLYYEACPTVLACTTMVTPQIIRMDGSGGTDIFKNITINRLTGTIDERLRTGATELSSFEGTCERAQAPQEEKPKF